MTVNELNLKLNEAIAAQSYPESAKLCRALLETCVDFIFAKADIKKPKKASLLELIDNPTITAYLDDAEIISAMHYVRILGMNAQHGRSVRRKEAKLAQDNIAYLVGIIESKETDKVCSYQKPPYMNEEATRKLYVDLYLKEAGWDVLDEENVVMPPKAGIEIKVEGMVNTEPFNNYDLSKMFGVNLAAVVRVVNLLHDSVVAKVA